MWKEFKAFAFKGNALDLAIGVIIGAAFGKIVTSIVNDLITPLMGVLIGGINFSEASFKVGKATIAYGSFIQNVIDFLIISFSIFLFVKMLNKVKRNEETKEDQPPEPSNEEILLAEIRDLLKKQYL